MPSQPYAPSPLDFVADNVELYESSGGTMGASLPGSLLPVLILTTTGARTGALRKSPLMRVEHEGRWLLVGSMGGQPTDPQWCWNLRAHPDAVVQDGPTPVPVRTRELAGKEREEWWARAVAAYPDYADYQRRTERLIPVFLATPMDAGEA